MNLTRSITRRKELKAMQNRTFTRSLLSVSMIVLVAVIFLQRYNLLNAVMAQPQEVKKVQKWDYCYVSSPFTYETANTWKVNVSYGGEVRRADSDSTGIAALNKLGDEGWELVSASDEIVRQNEPRISSRFILKRPR
jgi:hypothetical protein